MRSWFLAGLVLMVFAACSNEGGTTQQKIDSLEHKIDTTLERAGDSISAKAKELKEEIREKLESRKDANQKDSLIKDSTDK